MNEEFIKKCDEIFEGKNVNKINIQKLETYEKYINMKVSSELAYILSNFEGIMIKEEYGFISQQSSPFANEQGYEVIMDFIGLNTKPNLFSVHEMLKEQLPSGVYPIAEMDGGNYLCISNNGKVYIWLHEYDEHSSLFLANTSIEKFILSMVKMPKQNKEIDLNSIISEYSDDFGTDLDI